MRPSGSIFPDTLGKDPTHPPFSIIIINGIDLGFALLGFSPPFVLSFSACENRILVTQVTTHPE